LLFLGSLTAGKGNRYVLFCVVPYYELGVMRYELRFLFSPWVN
jgi:hypothetical protein